MPYTPLVLKSLLISQNLRQLFHHVGRNCHDNQAFVALLGTSQSAENHDTYWEAALDLIESDADLLALAAFLNSREANVYAAGGNFWNTVQSLRSELAYGQLLLKCGQGLLALNSLLELFAALCHLLYSNHGQQASMVALVRRVTGDQLVFIGDVEQGWAKGGAIVANGQIQLRL